MSDLPIDIADPVPGQDVSQRTFVNPTLWFEDRDGYRVIFCRHEILFRVACTDTTFLKLIAVSLRQTELATQAEIAKAFGHSVATQRRWECLFAQDGLKGFDPKPHSGRPPSIPITQHAFVQRWFQDGLSTAAIARRLAVSKTTARRLLRQLGLVRAALPEPVLPFTKVAPETTPAELVLEATEVPPPGTDATNDTVSPLPRNHTPLEPIASVRAEPPTDTVRLTDSLAVAPGPGTPEDNTVPLAPPPSPATQQQTPGQSQGESSTQDAPPPAVVPAGLTAATQPLQEPLTAATGLPNRLAPAVPLTSEAERVPPPPDARPTAQQGPPPPVLPYADSQVQNAPPPTVAPVGFTVDTNPFDRSGDRLLASQGLLADAVPLFGAAEELPRAGVLLALPALAEHGGPTVVQRVYGWLGRPAFYGLRTVVLTVVLLALLRIKRPENLKEHAPRPLGRLLGLDRALEVKTLRRQLSTLAARQLSCTLLDELAKERIAQHEERVAFLYLDGHVREYSGQEPLAKAKKPQRQVVTPATTDTWVHDAQGEPLLVVTSEMNAGLTSVLEPILDEVQRLLPEGQRLTAIFDRGGWSPKLFQRLIARGVDVITYRKGKKRVVPVNRFQEVATVVEGREKTYRLYDQRRARVGRLRPKRKRREGAGKPEYLWLRQVTMLREDGGQTTAVTNRQDLAAVEVLRRLFGRWCQENYFKYTSEEYALDALVEYGAEEVSMGDRPNPKRRKLERHRRQVKDQLREAQAELGAALAAVLATPDAAGGVKELPKNQEAVRGRIAVLEKRLTRLRAKIKKQPKRVPACGVKKLKTEKKRLVDGLKMMAYQVETSMLREVEKHYPRSVDEGRTLLHAIYQSSGRVEVKGNELWITIAQQSSPHRTAVLRKLCAEYDSRGVCYPGTNLRLRYAVEPDKPLIP
jgi:prepilin-type processing-associated H-X9-DG protein